MDFLKGKIVEKPYVWMNDREHIFREYSVNPEASGTQRKKRKRTGLTYDDCEFIWADGYRQPETKPLRALQSSPPFHPPHSSPPLHPLSSPPTQTSSSPQSVQLAPPTPSPISTSASPPSPTSQSLGGSDNSPATQVSTLPTTETTSRVITSSPTKLKRPKLSLD